MVVEVIGVIAWREKWSCLVEGVLLLWKRSSHTYAGQFCSSLVSICSNILYGIWATSIKKLSHIPISCVNKALINFLAFLWRLKSPEQYGTKCAPNLAKRG